MRIEANCPTCNEPIESYDLESGIVATYPGAIGVSGGQFIDGHQITTGEVPGPMNGIMPTITGNSDFDRMTLQPCGHILSGSEVRELVFRKYAEIPEELELGTPGADMVKATPSEVEAGGVLLLAHDGTTGASPALSRADTVKLRDWLTKLLEETT